MNRSDAIDKLAPALVAALAEIKNPHNSAANPHFRSKYAPLDECLRVARDALQKHGLTVLQSVCTEGDRTGVSTMILHSSGQWIESAPCYFKDRQDNAQGAGSCVTYARRYSLCAMLFIVGDDDDDGNAASADPRAKALATAERMLMDLDSVTDAAGLNAWKSAARAAWSDIPKDWQKKIDAARKAKEASING